VFGGSCSLVHLLVGARCASCVLVLIVGDRENGDDDSTPEEETTA
jgi:hypothetical protein